MFTGLIEDVGSVQMLEKSNGAVKMSIAPTNLDPNQLQLGESVAVDGICLTVVATREDVFQVVAGEETLRCTTAGSWEPETPVNLERALVLGDRLGGHLVTGHVDLVGEIVQVHNYPTNREVTVQTSSRWLRTSIVKGSIAIDGISLTINTIGEDQFSVALIPHTIYNTTLAAKRVGDSVNLEGDMIGKHVERLLQAYRLQ